MTMTNDQLEMEINMLKSQMTQKADVSTVNALSNRVTTAENTNSSQSNSINNLSTRVSVLESKVG
ncbi:hypothetical protein [Acinetobacter nosocomialis]|uniref:hypothetical protein n=1 Tax=Acinetobacter nosocomialis TaxID=106654 RepID=UPI0033B14D58